MWYHAVWISLVYTFCVWVFKKENMYVSPHDEHQSQTELQDTWNFQTRCDVYFSNVTRQQLRLGIVPV